MENITEKVLGAIKDKKPRSKWEFKIKNYSIWASGVLAVLVGSMATAVVIYMIANNDWNIRHQININPLELVFMSMPFYWILTIIILVVVAYYNFRHTSTGYRYKLMTIVMGSVLVSIILGVLFYGIGLGHIIDKTFAERLPIYEKFASPRRSMWISPEDGRIAGKITFIESSYFKIIDFDNNNWIVEPVLGDIKVFDVVRVIGEKTGEGNFRAKIIMPFDVRGQFSMPKGAPR